MSVVLAETKTGTSKPFLFKCRQLLTILGTNKVKKFLAFHFVKGRGGISSSHMPIRAGSSGKVCILTWFLMSLWLCQVDKLYFQSSRDYTSHVKPFASFTANECFHVLKKDVVSAQIQGELHRVEVLTCQNITTKTIVQLPLFAERDFRELVDDAGPGLLQDLCEGRRPEVRVTSLDPSMTRDPLYRTEDLWVENVITEQCLVATDETLLEDIYTNFSEDVYLSLSEDTFEIPVEKMSPEVLVVEEYSWMRDARKEPTLALHDIEEITEAESLTFSNYMIVHQPPPCPPKPRSLSYNKNCDH